jgi:hypothetical protein
MSKFVKHGSIFTVAANESLDVRDKLPVGTYTVKQNPQTGEFYLEQVGGYELKGKIYGDTLKQADRIIRTFESRSESTGVLLSGEKGSGKTLLAKKLSLLGQEKGYPTIVINNDWCGEQFNLFIQTISQPVVVIFDEFEKVYDDDHQEALLTLLDGVYPSQKLFILTSNDRGRVNSHMMNRPGRIFYRIDYAGLDRAFVTEYAEDNLENKKHIQALCQVSEMFAKFNFDILKAIVEEMNRYDESPQEAMQILNAKPDGYPETFKQRLVVDGKDVPFSDISGGEEIRVSATALNTSIYYKGDGVDEDGDQNWNTAQFTVMDMKTAGNGVFTYENKEGQKLTLTRFQPESFKWDAFGYAA